jgi:hypothetical protein
VSRDSSPLATSHRTPKSEQVLYEEDTQRSRQAIATASVINDAVKRAGNIAHELKSNVSAASVDLAIRRPDRRASSDRDNV